MKTVYFVLTLIVTMVGCYNPDYTTKQGVDVFCKDGVECPTQEHTEHALEYFAMRVPSMFGWHTVRQDLPGYRIFLRPHLQACYQSPEGCDLAQGTGIGVDIKIRYAGSYAASGLFQELLKLVVGNSLGIVDYESEEWLRTFELNNEYATIEKVKE